MEPLHWSLLQEEPFAILADLAIEMDPRLRSDVAFQEDRRVHTHPGPAKPKPVPGVQEVQNGLAGDAAFIPSRG